MTGVSLQDFHRRYLEREQRRTPFEQLRDEITGMIEYVYNGQLSGGRHQGWLEIENITPEMKRLVENLFTDFRFQWGPKNEFDNFEVIISW